MTTVLQRPPGAANDLFWAAPRAEVPINSQVVVGPDECVVAHLDGAVLGVLPPGSHWLHPQPFPFLAAAVSGGVNIRAELWFVRTSPVAGIQFGGTLGTLVDLKTGVRCSPRGFGEYALAVADPTAFVRACLGMTAAEPGPVVAWVTAAVARKAAGAFANLVEVERKGVLDASIAPHVAEALGGGSPRSRRRVSSSGAWAASRSTCPRRTWPP